MRQDIEQGLGCASSYAKSRYGYQVRLIFLPGYRNQRHDAHFIGDFPALWMGATSKLCRSPIWRRISELSVYCSFSIFFSSLTPPFSFLDKKFRCEDDPHCSFQCCDPASLLRHRKRFHDYIPTSRNYHKSNSPPSTRPQLSMEPVNSPIPQQQHNSPADQSPSEMCYGRELCSPVTRSTGSLDLDVVSLETDNNPPNLSDPDSTDPTLFYGQDTNSVEYWSSHFIDYNLQPHDGILTF